MKLMRIFPTALLSTLLLAGFTGPDHIDACFVSFTSGSNLTGTSPERLPETAEKSMTLKTDTGEAAITRIDGYRILYNNGKKVPFVNMKVELSEKDAYAKDQKIILANLRYLTAHSAAMETKDIIEAEYNGFKVYGLSRNTIESGSTLGIFVLFPGNGVTVYVYFNNLKPGYRNFNSLEEYKKQRNAFLNEYTRHLAGCLEK